MFADITKVDTEGMMSMLCLTTPEIFQELRKGNSVILKKGTKRIEIQGDDICDGKYHSLENDETWINSKFQNAKYLSKREVFRTIIDYSLVFPSFY